MAGEFKVGDISSALKSFANVGDTQTTATHEPSLLSLFTEQPKTHRKSKRKRESSDVNGKAQTEANPESSASDQSTTQRKSKRKRESGDGKKKKKSKKETKQDDSDKQKKKRKKSEGTADGEKEEQEEEEVKPTLKDEEAEVKEDRRMAELRGKRKKEGDAEGKKKSEEKKAKRAQETPEEKKAKLERTLFVGNVPCDLKPKKLKKIFKEYGKVESVRMRSVAYKSQILKRKVSFILREFNDQRKTCNAYVVFANKDDALKALKGAHNKEVGGFHIRVDLATGERKLDNSRTIFVGNLPFEAEEEDVRTHFTPCGDIDIVRLVRDGATNYGKGFGYVMFKDRMGLSAALRMNNAEFNGRPLRVFKAKADPKATGKQRHNRPPKATTTQSAPKNFQGVFSQKGVVPKINHKKKKK